MVHAYKHLRAASTLQSRHAWRLHLHRAPAVHMPVGSTNLISAADASLGTGRIRQCQIDATTLGGASSVSWTSRYSIGAHFAVMSATGTRASMWSDMNSSAALPVLMNTVSCRHEREWLQRTHSVLPPSERWTCARGAQASGTAMDSKRPGSHLGPVQPAAACQHAGLAVHRPLRPQRLSSKRQRGSHR